MNPHASLLCSTVQQFCQKFVAGEDHEGILDTCFSNATPRITEHGPEWANFHLPYLAKTFSGRRKACSTATDSLLRPEGISPSSKLQKLNCEDYFEALTSTLAFHPDENTFPCVKEFIVDPGTKSGDGGSVVINAKSKLSSVRTGAVWEETFVFMFRDFDADGRIGHLEIWSDSLSAWTAVTGAKSPSEAPSSDNTLAV